MTNESDLNIVQHFLIVTDTTGQSYTVLQQWPSGKTYMGSGVAYPFLYILLYLFFYISSPPFSLFTVNWGALVSLH